VVWAFWHLPLYITGQDKWSDIVFTTVWAITFTWVFNNAQGSVLIVMLMHNMNNTISGSFFNQMFSGAAAVSQAWLYTALWGAVAVVLVVVYRPEHLSRKHRKQEEELVQQPAGATAAPRVV
jgi:membrane protease YdiL (CAAX protease family)